METEKTALLFKALGDENRLRILKLVSQGEDLCACRILDELDITQPTLSHHMKILKDAGLITLPEDATVEGSSLTVLDIVDNPKHLNILEALSAYSVFERNRHSNSRLV